VSSDVFLASREPSTIELTLVAQQPMHIPDMNEILLPFRVDADGVLPFVDELERKGSGRRIDW